MGALGHPRVGIGRGDRQPGDAHGGQVGQVVADEGGLFRREAQGFEQAVQAGALVLLALVDVCDAQFLGPQRHRVADPRGDDRDLDAVAMVGLQSQPVVHVEDLGLATILGVPEAAVGERTVDVEHDHAHAGGALGDIAGNLGVMGVGHGSLYGGDANRRKPLRARRQTTRARSRSWMFSAPTTRSPASTTSSALIWCFSISWAASTASLSEPMVFGPRVISCATETLRRSTPSSSSARRRSPSVNTPSRRFSASTTAVMPRRLRGISTRASLMVASTPTRGTSSTACITSEMCTGRRRPRLPAGCERAKSSGVNPRASSRATASASPMTSAAVVLAVGASPCGQASEATFASRLRSAWVASDDFGLPVIEIRPMPWRLIAGRM